jgi:hypothetical protein
VQCKYGTVHEFVRAFVLTSASTCPSVSILYIDEPMRV